MTTSRFILDSLPDSLKPPATRFFLWLNFAWRWIGTALSFALFSVGSLLLGIIVMPLVVHLVRNEQRRVRWSRLVVGNAMRFFRFFMNAVGVLRYEITGTEHIQPGRNYLIIANHPSLIDVVFLLAMFPTAECVVKQALRDNFWTKHLMKGVGYISNQDPVQWLDDCVTRLTQGQSLILFPEGTRTRPGMPLDLKAGAAAVAVRAGVDCLPIVITCTPTTLTKAERWYQVPERRVVFSLKVQPPISMREARVGNGDDRQAGRSFNVFLHDYFTARLDAKPAAPGYTLPE